MSDMVCCSRSPVRGVFAAPARPRTCSCLKLRVEGSIGVRPNQPVPGPHHAQHFKENPQTMGASPEANKKLIRDYFDAVRSGASDKVVAAFADDVVWWVPPSSPMAGTYRGKDAVLGMFAKGVSLYAPKPMTIEIVGMVADDRKVAAEVHISATTAKGAEYSNFYHFLFELRDGKIAAVKEY